MTCYIKTSSKITASPNYKLCGKTNTTTPVVPCCASGDTCLSNGFCHFTRSLVGGSGYYTSGCSDAKFASAACPKLCNDQPRTDVVFDTTNNIWSCCGEDKTKNPACNNATKETFGAPPPQNLLQYWPALAAASTSSTSTASTTSGTSTATTGTASSSSNPSSSPSAAPASSPSPSSSGLSAGAAGGLGAGIAVVALSLIGLAVFFLLRRRNKGKSVATSTPYFPVDQGYKGDDSRPYSEQTMQTAASPSTAGRYQPSTEISRYGSPVELPAATAARTSLPPQELPAEDLPQTGQPSLNAPLHTLPLSLIPGSSKR